LTPPQTGVAYTANTVAGSYAVLASAGSPSTSFSLTNTPGPAATLSVVSVYAGGYCKPNQTYPGYWKNGSWVSLPVLSTYQPQYAMSETNCIVVQ
jgi:hypothetical protein